MASANGFADITVEDEPESVIAPADDEVSVVYVDYEAETGRKNFMGSCVIMLFGFLLFPASLMLLGWNENNDKCSKHLSIMAERDTEVGDCTTSAAVEDKFAFFSCPLDKDKFEDMTPLSTFNLPGLQELISINTIAGAQKVEMYQCIESKENVKEGSKEDSGDADDSDDDSDDSDGSDDSDAADDAGEDAAPAPAPGGSEIQQAQRTVAIDAKGRHQGLAKHAAKQKRQHSVDSVIATDSLLQGSLAQRGKDVALAADRSVIRTQHNHKGDRSSDGTAKAVYVYYMGWSHVYYDSRQFKAKPEKVAQGCADFMINGTVNHNPKVPDRGDGHDLELGRQKIVPPNVVAGPYTISDATELNKFSANKRINLTKYASKFSLASNTDNIIKIISPSALAVHPDKPYYLGSCRTDRLGCIRISYNKTSAKHMSVMGEVGASGVVMPLKIDKEWGCESSMFIRMFPEELTKKEFLEKLKPSENNLKQVMAFRVVGVIAAWLSLYCCFDPIANAAEMLSGVLAYVPVVGDLLLSAFEGVFTMYLCCISCSMGLGCGLLVVGIVWLTCQPLLGGPILIGSIIVFIVAFVVGTQSKRDPKKVRKQVVQKPYDPFRD